MLVHEITFDIEILRERDRLKRSEISFIIPHFVLASFMVCISTCELLISLEIVSREILNSEDVRCEPFLRLVSSQHKTFNSALLEEA